MTDDELYEMETPKFPGFIVADMGSLCNTSWNYKMFKLKKLNDALDILVKKLSDYRSRHDNINTMLYISVVIDLTKDEEKIIHELKDLLEKNPDAFQEDLNERMKFVNELIDIKKKFFERIKEKGEELNGTGSMEA